MAEKMLVTQALDERDLLVKTITDKIRKAKLVDTKKRNEEKKKSRIVMDYTMTSVRNSKRRTNKNKKV